MRARFSLLTLLLIIGGLLAPSLAAAQAQGSGAQSFTITDTRTGSGPCDFAVQRDLVGTVSISSRIDDDGNLVLSVGDIDMHGTLLNPENGKSVDIRWVHRNGEVSLVTSDSGADVLLGLEGTLFGGYDTARSELSMALPFDGATKVAFTAGEHAGDPWGEVCALLS